MGIEMEIAERYKTYDVLINKIYEQSEPSGLLLQNILKQERINRSHYLSLVWQIYSEFYPNYITNAYT
jgi:hypothetical protein